MSPHVIAVVARFVVGVSVGRHPELGVGMDGDEGGHLSALPPHHLHAALDGLALSLGEGRVPWNRCAMFDDVFCLKKGTFYL